MEQPTQFRSAFNGFNREDVVRYMEFVNNKHSAQVAQLNNELDFLRSKQEKADPDRVEELEEQLKAAMEENDALHCRIEALEQQLQEAQDALLNQKAGAIQPIVVQPQVSVTEELEHYRRAERAERVAKERARQVSDQTTAALSDAATKVDIASELISRIGRQVQEQLDLAQAAVKSSRQAFREAADVLDGLRDEMKE